MTRNVGSVVAGREVYHVRTGQTIREVAKYMTERRIGCVAVLDGDRLVGVVSERDVTGRVVAAGRDPDQTRVADVMTRDLVVAAVEESWDDAIRKMKQAGCRHLPVVQGDRLAGMVSLRDMLQADLTEKDEEIRWLNAYIHFTPPEP